MSERLRSTSQAQPASGPQDRLERLLEATSDGLFDWNINTGEIFFSPSYYSMLGYEPGGFPATFQGWRENLHPEDRPGNEAALNDYLRNPDSLYQREYRMRTKDGGWHWVLSRGRIVEWNPDGSPARMVGSHMDIQARKTVEDRYHLLFEHLEVGFGLHEAVLSPEGRLVDFRWLDINPAYERILGVGSQDLIGKTIREVFENVDPYFINAYEPVVLQGVSLHFERYSQNLSKWLESLAYRVNATEFAVIIQDVTQRKNAEISLLKSEEQYRLLIENSADLITRYVPSGRCLWVSPSFLAKTNFKFEEQIGRAGIEHVHPEDRPLVQKVLDSLLADGVAQQIRFRHLRSDGSWFWAESAASVLKDPSTGEVMEIHVFTRDIDALRRETRLVEETEALAKVGGWEHDIQSGVTRWTAGTRRILRVPEDTNPDIQTLNPFMTPESKAMLDAAMDRLMKTGEGWDIEIDTRCFDGEPISLRVTCLPEFQDGRLVRLQGVNQDITEHRKAEQLLQNLAGDLEKRVLERTSELREANRNLESFTYSVSHDLRAPLRALDGFSHILLEEYAAQLPQEGRHYASLIREGAQRMGRLIDDLLRFFRLGKVSLEIQTVDMESLFRQALEEIGPPETDLRLESTPLPPCRGDSSLLKQVWVNLLSNALKFSRNHLPSMIQVGWEEVDGVGAYYVRDNGVGFDMKYTGKLFQVFQRLHRQEDFEGTGLGLALVHLIVTRHGGRIWAESEPGKGSCFCFTIPPVEGDAS